MPCENCATQFTIFKRKRSCSSCQRLYCANCLGKRKKNQCYRCEVINQKPAPTKQELLDLKTRDLIFYLQSKKINIAGIVEKEELANLIINHVNSNSYYEQHSSTSTTPNHDFENYTQSFDQIKQTCQNLFTSISDKISTGNYALAIMTRHHHHHHIQLPIQIDQSIFHRRFSKDQFQPTKPAEQISNNATASPFDGPGKIEPSLASFSTAPITSLQPQT